MQVINIEAGVFRALKAYKVEKGLSDAAAAEWAVANLKEGVARFRTTLGQHKRDPETGVEEAYVALKTWAQS